MIELDQKIISSFQKKVSHKLTNTSLLQKQLYSFIATYINHPLIRSKIAEELNKSQLLEESLSNL